LEQRQAELDNQIASWKDTIETLQKSLQFHLAKTGKLAQKGEVGAKLAEARGLREACHIVLQERGEMDKEQLRDVLQSEGFKISTPKLRKSKSGKPIPAIQ
jgi:hypothetical protein